MNVAESSNFCLFPGFDRDTVGPPPSLTFTPCPYPRWETLWLTASLDVKAWKQPAAKIVSIWGELHLTYTLTGFAASHCVSVNVINSEAIKNNFTCFTIHIIPTTTVNQPGKTKGFNFSSCAILVRFHCSLPTAMQNTFCFLISFSQSQISQPSDPHIHMYAVHTHT